MWEDKGAEDAERVCFLHKKAKTKRIIVYVSGTVLVGGNCIRTVYFSTMVCIYEYLVFFLTGAAMDETLLYA